MKRTRKIISLLLSIAIMFGIVGNTAFAAERLSNAERVKKYVVYNGNGEILYEAESLTDAENYMMGRNTNCRSTRGIIKIAKAVIDAVSPVGKVVVGALTIYEINQTMAGKSEIIDIISIHFPISELLKIAANKQAVYVYSKSGLIQNPYPPNSYQGSQWYKTNFYCVVAK